jgi:hypothetical protein
MSIKGMNTEAIADVLELQPITESSWLARAAEQCEKVNEAKMKNMDLPKKDNRISKEGRVANKSYEALLHPF